MFVVKRDGKVEEGAYFTKPYMAKALMHRLHREDGLARVVETWPDANARPVYSVAAEPNRIQAKQPLAKPRSGLTLVKREKGGNDD